MKNQGVVSYIIASLLNGVKRSLDNISNAFKIDNYNKTFQMKGKNGSGYITVSMDYYINILMCAAAYLMLDGGSGALIGLQDIKVNLLSTILSILLFSVGIMISIGVRNRINKQVMKMNTSSIKVGVCIAMFIATLDILSVLTSTMGFIYGITLIDILKTIIYMVEILVLLGLIGYYVRISEFIVEEESKYQGSINNE